MAKGEDHAVINLLISYLPGLLAERLLRQPGQALLGRAERYRAAVLFADLAKFTPLTEALCRVGTAGAEELTLLLNRYFTGQIAEVKRWGGVVGKFAGDAMTILFLGEQAAARAAACAQGLLLRGAEMARVQTLAGEFELRMKLGLAYGEVLQFVAGDETRQEFIFAGRPLDAAAQAEHYASPGEIILDASALAQLPPGWVETAPLVDGFGRLVALHGQAAEQPLPPLPAPTDPAQAIQALRPFLPRQAYERIRMGSAGFVNEHRQVSVLFVNFEGINYLDERAPALLGDYLRDFFAVVERFGGYIRQVEMGDKGSKVIVQFGAPAAHENDEERALLCALELKQLVARNPIITAQCIGVTSGKAFVGNLGAPDRQEYAVMGDVVNLSARLMQAAAPQRILVDEPTCRAAGQFFAWELLDPITVKGKSQPVPVFALTGRLHRRAQVLLEERYALPMVGRTAELQRLAALLAQVQLQGRGVVVGITAEAGLGKTRLATEVIHGALQMGFQGLRGNGLSHGMSTAYLAWRPILRSLLELDDELSPLAQQEQIEARLRQVNPALVERLPLLGDVLGTAFPETPLTASLDARQRQESLTGLVTDLVRMRAAAAPLLLVLEDAHWLDELSRRLVQAVAAAIRSSPVFFLTVYRPRIGDGEPALWEAPPGHFTELRLEPFSPDEMRQLVELKLGQVALPAALLEKIEQLSGGNPFFIDEFINLIQARGIHLDDAQALQAAQVPDSIQGLLITRLDQLAESEKMTVQVASVIGQLFRSQWLYAIYPGDVRNELLQRDLQNVYEQGIFFVERPSPELEYLFRHAILHEVAYGMLSFANRRMLHERVAAYLAHAYASNIDAWYGILSFHYGRAEQFASEYHYTGLAARQANRQGSYRQAFHFFSRAIELHQAHTLASPEDLFDLYADRFAVAMLLGEHEQAMQDALAMQALAPGLDPARQVTSLICLGQAYQESSSEENPRPYYQQAIDLARQHNNKDGLLKALYLLGATYFATGDYETAKQMLRQVIAEADESTWRQKAHAQQVLGWVIYDEGDYQETERLWLNSYAAMQAHQHKSGEAMLLTNLGAVYCVLGAVDRGLAYYEQSMHMATQLGYKSGEAEAARLLGDALRQVGQYERAAPLLEHAIELGEQLSGDPYLITYCWMCQAEMLLETGGDLAEAEGLIGRALALIDPERGKELAGWLLHTAGRVNLRLGHLALALQQFETAIQYRREIQQLERVKATLADLGLAQLQMGDLPAAQQCADEMVVLLGEPDVMKDGLAACMAVYQIGTAAGQAVQALPYLQRAYASLRWSAERIEDADIRRTFLEEIALHRQIVQEYNQPRP